MGVQVAFSYSNWALLFPQFSNLNETQITTLILPIAEGYCRNDGGGPVSNAANQTNLLNLIVAHVAQLMFGSTTDPLSSLVGRVADAAQGSVRVAVDMPTEPGAAWFNQTQWGAMFYQMSQAYRTFRYVPRARRNFNPWPNQ